MSYPLIRSTLPISPKNGRVPLNQPSETTTTSCCCCCSLAVPQWLRPSPPLRSSPPPSPRGSTAAWPGSRARAGPPRWDWPCDARRATSRRGSRSPRSCPASSASCSRETSSAAPYDVLSFLSWNNVHTFIARLQNRSQSQFVRVSPRSSWSTSG